MQNIIKISIFIIFFFVIGVFFVSLNKDTNYNTNSLIGKKIHNINLKYFDKNKFYKEDDLKKNNFTLINFWASWCAPCREEHPLLINLSREKNLKLLGVTTHLEYLASTYKLLINSSRRLNYGRIFWF